ncbi:MULTISPECIES: hypothetical protein [unclassified Leifsonia]|uniref:hypothetical protein n=1 Tax=unclassified Leifsonia TaxID=2663824 RepID=UPI0008A7C19B|nr:MULTISPECIES: hypothetical protein [unclassified Leifsonia]SEI10891.1 hypothetical protein SAMN04515694_1166 [Leifsonia sp. CL154]SFL90105.1 hypothetical protein SAMN04515692_11671 [Leifsonia sp. CL147]
MDDFTEEDPGFGEPGALDGLTGRLRQDQYRLEEAHNAVRKSAEAVREHWHGKTGEAAAAAHDALMTSIISKHAALDRAWLAFQTYRDEHEDVKDQARAWVNQLAEARQTIGSAAAMVKGPRTAPGMDEVIAMATRTKIAALLEEQEALERLATLYEERAAAGARLRSAITDITDEQYGSGITARAVDNPSDGFRAATVVSVASVKSSNGNFGYPFGYDHEYNLGPALKGKTPEQIFAYIKSHFGEVFPPAYRLDESLRSLTLTHVGQVIHTELRGLDLDMVAGDIKVAKLTSTSYTIESLPGHPEYPGTVQFSIRRGANGDNYLDVKAGYKQPTLAIDNELYAAFTAGLWNDYPTNIRLGMNGFQEPQSPFDSDYVAPNPFDPSAR